MQVAKHTQATQKYYFCDYKETHGNGLIAACLNCDLYRLDIKEAINVRMKGLNFSSHNLNINRI